MTAVLWLLLALLALCLIAGLAMLLDHALDDEPEYRTANARQMAADLRKLQQQRLPFNQTHRPTDPPPPVPHP